VATLLLIFVVYKYLCVEKRKLSLGNPLNRLYQVVKQITNTDDSTGSLLTLVTVNTDSLAAIYLRINKSNSLSTKLKLNECLVSTLWYAREIPQFESLLL